MLRAIAQMQDWLMAHSANELAETMANYFPGKAREILVSAFERYRADNIWARTPDVSREGFARLGNCLRSGGFLCRAPVYEECTDEIFRTSAGRPRNDS